MLLLHELDCIELFHIKLTAFLLNPSNIMARISTSTLVSQHSD